MLCKQSAIETDIGSQIEKRSPQPNDAKSDEQQAKRQKVREDKPSSEEDYGIEKAAPSVNTADEPSVEENNSNARVNKRNFRKLFNECHSY